MHSRFDSVIAIAWIAAVGSVFGFLGGVIADTDSLVVPIAAIAFLLAGAVLFGRVWRLCRGSSPPQAEPVS